MFRIVTFLIFWSAASICLGSDLFHEDTTWPDSTLQSLSVFGSGVALDQNDNIVILHRGSVANKTSNYEIIREDTILIVDHKGKLVATWGKGKFVKPHGIEITSSGDMFITDVSLHQVFKFSHNHEDGLWLEHPEFVLGQMFISGSDNYHFCKPADVAVVETSQDFFVADGYCNFRVVRFNRFGSYISEFSAASSNPTRPSVAFNVTHALAIGVPCTGDGDPIVFVADRNNGRIQVFTQNGTFLQEIDYTNFGTSPHMLLSLAVVNDHSKCSEGVFQGTLFAVNGHLPQGQPKVFEIRVSSTSYEVIHSFPVSSSRDIMKNQNGSGALARTETPHDLAVASNGSILYVVEAYEPLTIKRFVRSGKSSSGNKFRPYTLTNVFYILQIFLVSMFFSKV